jgi:hypothetical protein
MTAKSSDVRGWLEGMDTAQLQIARMLVEHAIHARTPTHPIAKVVTSHDPEDSLREFKDRLARAAQVDPPPTMDDVLGAIWSLAGDIASTELHEAQRGADDWQRKVGLSAGWRECQRVVDALRAALAPNRPA